MESGYSTGLQNKHSISLMKNKHHIECKTFVRTSDITTDRSTVTSGVSSDFKQGSKIMSSIITHTLCHLHGENLKSLFYNFIAPFYKIQRYIVIASNHIHIYLYSMLYNVFPQIALNLL